MPVTTYTYSKAVDFSGGFDSDGVMYEIEQSSISTPLDTGQPMRVSGDVVEISFSDQLSSGDKNTLDGDTAQAENSPPEAGSVLGDHTGNPRPLKPEDPIVFDAVVGSDHQYTLPSQAFSAGAKSVFVQSGFYTEEGDINIPEGGVLQAEAIGGVYIELGPYSIRSDGSGRLETTGTISITHNTQVITGVGTTFTNLAVNDFILLNDVWHRIALIASDTSMFLYHPYQGATISGGALKAQSMIAGSYVINIIAHSGTSYGLYVKNSYHFSAQNCLFSRCGADGTHAAIHMEDTYESYLIGTLTEFSNDHGMTMKNCDRILLTNIAFKSSFNHGLCMDGCTRITMDGSYFVQNKLNGAEFINACDYIKVTDSTFEGNQGVGFHSSSVTTHTILDSCDVVGNVSHGAELEGDAGVVNDCVIYGNGGSGLCLRSTASDSIMQGCIISNNTAEGILVDQADDCVITGNRVMSNGTEGCEIVAGSTDNIVRTNNFKGNTGTNYVDNGTGTDSDGNKT